MRLLRRSLQELWGLFVDDGASAALVVGWIAAACLVLPAATWSGPVLFAGLAAIVAFSTVGRRR